MAITINGSGTVTGLSVGGLPDGTVDAGTLATDSVTAVKIPDTVEADLKSGRKNLIINGAMQVAQRGTSHAAISNGAYSLDRFRLYNSTGAYTVTQDSDGPDGFANSYKIDCTTADASPASGGYIFFRQLIEGQNLQHLKKGTSGAEAVTLSFWLKSNKTGDIQVALYDYDNSRQIAATVTINVADTWEQKTVTFAGDTSGTFADDNGGSLAVEMWFDAGSNYTSGDVPTAWETAAGTDRAVGVTLALADSTSNYLNITGIQLEVGSQATDFEHRSYGEELALCQRYYEPVEKKSTDGTLQLLAASRSASNVSFEYKYQVEKRTSPTITHVGSSWGVTDSCGQYLAAGSDGSTSKGAIFYCNCNYSAASAVYTATTGIHAHIDAEL